MHAIILAAGRGSRLNDLTSDKPKCMVEVAGKTLLSYQVDALNHAGISNIAVVAGYLSNRIDTTNIQHTFINNRWHETNMVRSLMSASDWLTKHTCIISYADIFYQPTAITSLIESDDDISVLYDENFMSLWNLRFENPLSDLENFKLDSNRFVTHIGGRSLDSTNIQGQYMGLLKFTPNGWNQINSVLSLLSEKALDRLDMTTLLQELINSGYQIRGIPYSDGWGEVDHKSDIDIYEANGLCA